MKFICEDGDYQVTDEVRYEVVYKMFNFMGNELSSVVVPFKSDHIAKLFGILNHSKPINVNDIPSIVALADYFDITEVMPYLVEQYANCDYEMDGFEFEILSRYAKKLILNREYMNSISPSTMYGIMVKFKDIRVVCLINKTVTRNLLREFMLRHYQCWFDEEYIRDDLYHIEHRHSTCDMTGSYDIPIINSETTIREKVVINNIWDRSNGINKFHTTLTGISTCDACREDIEYASKMAIKLITRMILGNRFIDLNETLRTLRGRVMRLMIKKTYVKMLIHNAKN
jgi:hypothetical protein